MSVPCLDGFSDLLCREDSTVLSGGSPECSSEFESQNCSEESIASFIEDERNFVQGNDYVARFRSDSFDSSARTDSVAWILKVHSFSNMPHLALFEISQTHGQIRMVIRLLSFYNSATISVKYVDLSDYQLDIRFIYYFI